MASVTNGRNEEETKRRILVRVSTHTLPIPFPLISRVPSLLHSSHTHLSHPFVTRAIFVTSSPLRHADCYVAFVTRASPFDVLAGGQKWGAQRGGLNRAKRQWHVLGVHVRGTDKVVAKRVPPGKPSKRKPHTQSLPKKESLTLKVFQKQKKPHTQCLT